MVTVRVLRNSLARPRVAGLALLALFGQAAAADVDAPGERRNTLVHEGIERSYVVRTPPRLAKRGPVPLVLVLHGGGGNAEHAERMTGFTAMAQREGFMVVYPEGTGRPRGRLLTWNAGHCCGYALRSRANDVGFIDALLTRLSRDYPVDPARIYATGMSNGGMMAHRLGMELAHRFAAIAPVVATLFGDEKLPAHPVSAIMLNGMLDESVPFRGGAPGGRFPDAWNGMPAQPAEAQAAFWARANGCANAPEELDRGSLVLTRYRCPANRGVELYLLRDNGHAWPGGQAGSRRGDRPTTSLDATDVIWEFFRAHPKQ
jgi:polyhydroxybutyrate depolymerase